jgi:DUF1680 family protein
LFLRIPAWCEDGATLDVNGSRYEGTITPGTYVELRREWQPGDAVRLTLPMPVRRIECHPYVAENHGRVAIMRGPLLYCIEQADNPGSDPRDIVLPAEGALNPEFRDDLLGGVTILRGPAEVRELPGEWTKPLYRTAQPTPREGSRGREVELVAVPYLAWANREPGRMQVWLHAQGA